MKPIYVAVTALLASAANAELPPAAKAALQEENSLRKQYETCVIDAALVLGRNNHEAADTVVRGAQSKCGGLILHQMNRAAREGAMSVGYIMSDADAARKVDKIVAAAADKAIAALLEARAQ